ncbi:MAG: Ribosomal silencing factor RsfS [Firmicutes bacterium]|nr:Ribosomal silencing factor RsfS [Bacillota bacterium]
MVTDYFVVVSGSSGTHTRALADHVVDGLSLAGAKLQGKESDPFGKWILLDYVAVIVHVFDEETRDFYNLERLWGEAMSVPL